MTEVNETEWLRGLYIEDLSKMVTYHKNARSRVAHPGKWKALPSLVSLGEGITAPIDLPINDPDRKVWVWSDQHFFHKNIIAFSERPHADVEEMNEHLIANYNDYVGENDVCIWGGDVGFGGNQAINKLLAQCNGYKILVVGNHDFKKKHLRHLDFDETHLVYSVDYPDVSLFFTHYPMANIPWPWVNIHGHLHLFPYPETGHPLNININCEVQGYRPRLLSDVAKQAKLRVISAKI